MKYTVPLLASLFVLACTQSNTKDMDLEARSSRGIRNGDSAVGKYSNVGAFEDSGQFFCSGTLISPSVVLTAAHCVSGAVLPNVTFTTEIGSAHVARSTDYRIHPRYSEFELPNLDVTQDYIPSATEGIELPSGADLALIKLNNRAKDFKPYTLGTATLAQNQALTAVGFGRDEREVSGVKRLGEMKLDAYFSSVGLLSVDESVAPPQINLQEISEGLIRAVPSTSRNQTICPGDSGGPLLKKNGDSYEITGVASWAFVESGIYIDEENFVVIPKTNCNRVSDVYHTTVKPHEAWIRQEREKMDPSGACNGDDTDEAGTLNGGCLLKQGTNGLVFSKAATISIDSTTVQRFGKSAAVSYCDNLVEGGFSDWSLPTKGQLVEAATAGGFEHLNLGAERYYWYWSQTTSGLSPDSGTAVNLVNGQAHVGYPLHLSYPLAVVCVRNGN